MRWWTNSIRCLVLLLALGCTGCLRTGSALVTAANAIDPPLAEGFYKVAKYEENTKKWSDTPSSLFVRRITAAIDGKNFAALEMTDPESPSTKGILSFTRSNLNAIIMQVYSPGEDFQDVVLLSMTGPTSGYVYFFAVPEEEGLTSYGARRVCKAPKQGGSGKGGDCRIDGLSIEQGKRLVDDGAKKGLIPAFKISR